MKDKYLTVAVQEAEKKLYHLVNIISMYVVDAQGEVVRVDPNKCIRRKIIHDD